MLRIELLGAFRVSEDGQPLSINSTPRLQALLAYLILRRDAPQSRKRVAFLFWPDSTDEQALANLRNLWHRLRRSLPRIDPCLLADEATVAWRNAPGICAVDVVEFELRLRHAALHPQPDEQIGALEQAVSLYRGELLPGAYNDWLLAERERLAEEVAGALEQLAGLYEARGDYAEALRPAQELLRCDPLRETAYARLMRLHALNDDRAAALRAYHLCESTLRRELNVAPAAATRDLYERLLSATPQVGAPPALQARPLLVGRETQWATLRRAWRNASGLPALVLISGEAGIGKTRLAEALADWVDRQGVRTMRGRCYAAGGALPYGPLVSWLRSCPLPPLAEPWLRDLARLLPEIVVKRADLAASAPSSEPWQRARLFEAITRALARDGVPLLLLLDDLQWCDRDTLEWLAYLLQSHASWTQERRAPLLIVATLRTEEAPEQRTLDVWRAGLRHVGQLVEIELGPLNCEDTLKLADATAGRPFERALAAELCAATEGNPLFVVEAVRAGFTGAGDRASIRIREVIQARLDQLSPPARAAAEAAAVIGRAFSYPVLAATSEQPADALVQALDELWRRRVIRERENDAYDFSHDRLREACYEAISRTRRRWLHERAAVALEQAHAEDRDAAALQMASHYEAAGRPEPAIQCYERAAERARRIHSHEEALTALDKAVALLQDADRAPRAAGVRVREARGDARDFLMRHAEARADYADALALTPAADALTAARLHRKIGQTFDADRAQAASQAAEYSIAERLLGRPHERDAPPEWWEEWCQIQLNRQLLMYWCAATDELARSLTETIGLIEAHGTPQQRAKLYGNLARELNRRYHYARCPEVLEYARAALATLPPDAGPELCYPYRFSLGFNLVWHGDPEEAARVLREALGAMEQCGDPMAQVRCLTYLALAERRRKRVALAEAVARRAHPAAVAAAMPEYIGQSLAHLAWAAWQQGRLAEAERLGLNALEALAASKVCLPFFMQELALWPLLGVALAQRRLADAVARARELTSPIESNLPEAISEPFRAALAAWDAGRPAEARRSLEQAVASAQALHLS